MVRHMQNSARHVGHQDHIKSWCYRPCYKLSYNNMMHSIYCKSSTWYLSSPWLQNVREFVTNKKKRIAAFAPLDYEDADGVLTEERVSASLAFFRRALAASKSKRLFCRSLRSLLSGGWNNKSLSKS